MRTTRILACLMAVAALGACSGGSTSSDTPPSTHAISGSVTGAVLQNVSIALSGPATRTTTTDAGGHYTFTGLADGAYTVTPTLATFSFTPTSRAVTVNGADVTAQDFVAATTGLVLVNADITVPTAWTKDHVYRVTRSIRVTSGLGIEAGTRVEFDPGVDLTVSGTITANGLVETTPIVFTSSRASPAAGDWGGITLTANGSIFSYCAVLYAGNGDVPAMRIQGASASVTHCTFAHHVTTNDTIVGAPALDASDATAGTVIASNLFFDDKVPLAINTTFSVDDTNVFDNAAAAPTSPQPSKFNAIVLPGCAHVATPVTWGATKVPFVVGNPNDACNYVVVDAAGQLTLASRAVVKFFEHGRIAVNGRLLANAAAGEKITFTAFADDSAGGDTNADQGATPPANGAWEGLTANANGSSYVRAAFLYAGGGDASALSVGSGKTVTVQDSTFAHTKGTLETIRAAPALDLSDAASGTVVTGNVFFDNVVPLSINTTFSLDDSNAFTGAATPGGPTLTNTFQAVVVRGCAAISANILWGQVKVPYVIGNPNDACNYVNIDASGHLTLADTAVVKFFKSGGMTVNGLLTANAVAGIAFTAFGDDAHGGDTNADGAATAAAGGDWAGMIIRRTGSVFNKTSFLYAGGASSGESISALEVGGGFAVTVTNSVFGHVRTAQDNLRAPPAVDLAAGASVGLVFTGNTFFDTTVPLGISAEQSLDDSNTFNVAGTTDSKYNGIVVAGCDAVTGNTSWLVTKVPLVVGNAVDACNYLTVPGGGHLTLGPNVTLKFFLNGRIDVSAGALFTVDATDYLTCIADDHVNDTNADGTSTTPAVGDWAGVKRHFSGSDPVCDQSAYMHWQEPNDGSNRCTW